LREVSAALSEAGLMTGTGKPYEAAAVAKTVGTTRETRRSGAYAV
jgi:hypothetical protein